MELLFSKKDLRRLIIPLVFEQALAITVGMADTMMVSSVGEAAVSGVSGTMCFTTVNRVMSARRISR